MLIKLMIFALQATEITEQALEVNPYNALAYGVLVAILIAAVAVLYRQLLNERASYREDIQTERRSYRELADKSIGILSLVETKIDVISETNNEVKELRRDVVSFKETIDRISRE